MVFDWLLMGEMENIPFGRTEYEAGMSDTFWK
jgi:hypothetical protein